MALLKKILLPLCVLIVTLILCVYIPSSTTIIAATYPKAILRSTRPTPEAPSQQQTNTSSADRSSLIRSVDIAHLPNNTAPPTRVLSEPDQSLASKQKNTFVKYSNMVTKHPNLSWLTNLYENKTNESRESDSNTSVTSDARQYNYGYGNGKNQGYKQKKNESIINDDEIQREVDTKEGAEKVDIGDGYNGNEHAEEDDEFLRDLNDFSTKSNNITVTSSFNLTTSLLSTGDISSNDKCKPITKIVFIKTHKTGSTTTASIFERFGYLRHLMFALPRARHVFSTHSYFNKKGVVPIPSVLSRSHPHYDILCNHAVYYRPELDKTVPNATYITILRDPVKQLESAFGYFEMARGMKITKYPNPFEMFMQKPHFYYKNCSYTMKTQSRNGQLYDLGLIANNRFDHADAIVKKINSLDKEFDLVLITEYFDESLILMKKLLCWSFDDVLYISNGIRSKSHRYTISDKLRRKVRQWNAGDVLLYNHFNKTLWKKIEDYGPTFQEDLETFRRLEKEAIDKCVDTSKLDRVDRREDKFVISPKHAGTFCQDLLRADVPYTALIKKKLKEISIRAVDRISSHRQMQYQDKKRHTRRTSMRSKMMKG